ncbi:ABC transporter transmembrane domain-containing protein [Microbacterium sp. No. 7]|uniref:ABC transporter transmembrane domain-containing protein n=1 Tax=Microbacterium sp. No. 7 TaxID=1714373 RepID=UPI0006D216C6|nr:ABC transporter ATP-binding protein [Microbacterium sp. No. 7]
MSRSASLRILLSRRRALFAVATAGLIGHQIAEALVPVVIGVVIDRAIEPGDGVQLALWLGVLALLFAGLLLSWRYGELASVRASEKGARALRHALVARILAPSGFASPRRSGDLLSVAGTDVERATGLVWVVGSSLAQLAAVLTAAVSLLIISVPVGLLVLVATPVLVLVLHVVTAPLERRMDAEQAAAASASAVAADLLTGLRALRDIGAEAEASARFAEASGRARVASRRAVAAKGAFAMVSMSASALLLAAIAWAGAAQAQAGALSVGELVAVLGLAQFLHGPVSGLAFVGAELAGVRASAKRTDAVLDAPPALEVRPVPDAARDGTVALEGVTTPHAGPVSATIPAGAWAALRVADPRGARELREVLAGVRLPDAGRVTVDGETVVDAGAAASVILAPPAQPAVFAGTLHDNVVFHGDGAGNGAAQAAAHAAALDDVLELARHDWDMSIGERGLTLSGGQRQRVSLARALARDAAVLVLHAPTSAADSVTEALIAQRTRRLRAGRTTVLIDAAPALVQGADVVIDVEAGR